jgi:hypothetical protein
MIKWNFLILILLFILGTSCSRERKVSRIIPGHTTINEALEWLDEPINVQTSGFATNEEVFIWKDLTIQVDRKIVKAVHRIPASHEKSLQYWRHEFKNEVSDLKKIDSQKGEELYQLKFPYKGIDVVYNSKADEVIKVVYYEVEE